MKHILFPILIFSVTVFSCKTADSNLAEETLPNYSGIYPHLAYYNEEAECGTGAVVPWADRLWVITYGPHLPFGSSDKLYEITPDLQQIVREESIGGTPANRMIHNESNQLFIGPYAIDTDRNVRAISYEQAPGRYTGLARHLTDPEDKILIATMEEGFYEVDVHSLETTTLHEDGNVLRKEGHTGQYSALLPGSHGKGFYSGQGVLVYSNNGEDTPDALKKFDIEAGALAEFRDGEWEVIRRNQFVEVTGPGGIYGNSNPETDPIWTTGWDHRSVLVGVRDNDQWSFYRLPKASHSYDGAHGWNTEWPRIRDVGTPEQPDYLMTMHGMFWKFPKGFSSENSAGIRPRSAYLKVIGDYTRWNNQLVFGCDDSAQREFLNKRTVKGGIEGPGQSNSNLWFTPLDQPDRLGPNTAGGAVYISEPIKKDIPSEPFLFAGWDHRSVWILNEGKEEVTFRFEVDRNGNGKWEPFKSIDVQPGETVSLPFDQSDAGEWIRVISNKDSHGTIHFTYTDLPRFQDSSDPLFRGLARVGQGNSTGGLLYGLGDNRRALGVLAGEITEGRFNERGYYELDAQMNLVKKENPETAEFIRDKFAIPTEVITVEPSSVLIVDDQGRRWRLPLGEPTYTEAIQQGLQRVAREVATERDLLSTHGTFYELPAENADGFAKIRPISSHNFNVHDFASYRGLLVMTGVGPDDADQKHIIRSADGNASVWVGAIDDLWKLGKPVGEGGPWKNTQVVANQPSDPYLIGFYDDKSLSLSHNTDQPVTFKVEVEPIGHGPWMTYKEIKVAAGEIVDHQFPESFQARWIRFSTDADCEATTWLKYE